MSEPIGVDGQAGMRVGIVGDGAWGQALATLSIEAGNQVLLGYTGRKPRRKLSVTKDLTEVSAHAELILLGVLAWEVRDAVRELNLGPQHRVIFCTRGPDPDTGRWLTQLLPQISPVIRVGILGGPVIPAEVLKGVPTAAIIASRFDEVNRLGQQALHSPKCRVYTGDDPEAIELAGAMAQVLAVAVGVADQMQAGAGVRGMVISRGLAEMRRLAAAVNVDPGAFGGLAGIGDLVASFSLPDHEAYKVGRDLGGPRDHTDNEAILTAGTALALAKRLGVEIPLTKVVYGIAHGKIDVETAMASLMERSAKAGEG
ncbi:MAG: glycerol-3-phosphate dehydrogenase (NAD(P)+) [Cognaticolwellia sp.]|jgi:glycerol-3-phosphate dehydrogenase (NAD(P)+)